MYRVVTDAQVAAYMQLVESYAAKYRHYKCADYDDLRQEGLISVWEALRRGNRPSADVIRFGMLSWLRKERRLVERGDSIAAMYVSLTPEWQAEFGRVLTGTSPGADREVPGSHSPS